MTSWPWMKGIDIAIADPISVDDGRPSIKELIHQHREAIAAVREQLAAAVPAAATTTQHCYYDPTKHDALWILRFVLSHKKSIPKAVKAAQKALALRAQHHLDDVDIRFTPPTTALMDKCPPAFRRYSAYTAPDTFLWTLPDAQRGVVTFVRYAGLNQKELVKNVEESDWLPTFLYVTEWTHQWLDFTSRTTGRLTKNTRLIDLSDMHITDISRENMKRGSKTMNAMEDSYPQLLNALYVVNPPYWIDAGFLLFRPFMPKRVLEKFDVLHPASKEKDRKTLYKVVDKRLLPARFGGDNEQWPVEFPLPGPKR